MKKYITLLLILCAVKGMAQGVDSTRIPQTMNLPQKYHVYVLGFNQGSWGAVDFINYINQVRAQMDSVNMEKSISVTVPSSLVRDVFQSMSRQPEGEATQYNENIQAALGPQITNPWLGAQVNSIVMRNWAARDARIEATKKELIKIKKTN
jgi:hypothetical protein